MYPVYIQESLCILSFILSVVGAFSYNRIRDIHLALFLFTLSLTISMNSASIWPTWYNTIYMECYLIHSQCKYILQFNVPECSLSFDFFCNHFFYCTKRAPISSQTRSICSLIFCSCINTFTQHPLTPKHRPHFTLCTQSTGQPNKAYTFCHLMILIERYT